MNVKISGPVDGHTAGTNAQIISPVLDLPQEEFAALAGSIFIAIPHRPSEGINSAMIQAAGVWARFATPTATLQDQFGGFVELTRAGIARTFLEYCRERPQIRYLVMCDSDQSISWDAPYRLAHWGEPIVSGVVCTISDGRGVQACFTLKDEYGNPRFPSTKFTRTMPGRGLIPVNSCGTGLICIRKDVLESVFNAEMIPFLIPEDDRIRAAATGIMKFGEDIAFCRQAESLGFGRFVDLSVHADHMKTVAIRWPPESIDYEMDPSSWMVDPRDYSHAS